MSVDSVPPYPKVMDIPEHFIPKEGDDVSLGMEEKRLVFIGDVHGMLTELKRLLVELDYNSQTDHLVFTGDLVTKGPDSLSVIDFIRESGASCVRGNKDHDLLLEYYRRHHSLPDDSLSGEEAGMADSAISNKQEDEVRGGMEEKKERGDKKHKNTKDKKSREVKCLAKKMTKLQAEWLNNCPLILRANGVKGLGNVAVVHAGLVHGTEFESQDPFAVMNMRTIDVHTMLASRKSHGKHWAKIWNQYEKKGTEDPTTVIYGHFASKGLDLRPLTKGLDSNCVRGGRLTALVVSSHINKPEAVSVACRDEAS